MHNAGMRGGMQGTEGWCTQCRGVIYMVHGGDMHGAGGGMHNGEGTKGMWQLITAAEFS